VSVVVVVVEPTQKGNGSTDGCMGAFFLSFFGSFFFLVISRYDLGATPLPYSSHSTLYKKLFPKSTRSSIPSQRSAVVVEEEEDPDSDDEEESDLAGRYQPDQIVPPCTRCGGVRVFEMQLVPGLISVLKPELLTTSGATTKRSKKNKKITSSQTAEERRKEIAAMLSGRPAGQDEDGDGDGVGEVAEAGMEWGTVMVFGCKSDCVGFGEEWVGVEWEEAIV
jgi:pre-rRNA-processing protein TSR4